MRSSQSIRLLRWVAFGAAAALTASGEFSLAGLAGWPAWVAWLLPVALDVYAFAAFATGRRADTMAALALMIAANTVYHLAATGLIPVSWQLVVIVAALPPVICWRVHHLGAAEPAAQVAAEPAAEPAEVPAPLVPEVAAPEVAARPVPEVPARPQRRQAAGSGTRVRRDPATTRALAASILAEQPGISRTALAARIGISDRQLRNVVPAAA